MATRKITEKIISQNQVNQIVDDALDEGTIALSRLIDQGALEEEIMHLVADFLGPL